MLTPGTDINRVILSEDQAIWRRDLIDGDVKYKIIYNFNAGTDYKGYVRVKFNLFEQTEIFLDYNGEYQVSIDINSTYISDPFEIRKMRKEGKIYIEEKYSKAGKNKISLFFENKYYQDYLGIHSYIDSNDNQYVFSQTVPYWGNRILPMFDQPNIKGEHKIFIIAPKDWMAITTGNKLKTTEISPENLPKIIMSKELYFVKDKHFWILNPAEKNKQHQKCIHEFQNTPRLPSYLHNFVLGTFNIKEYYDEEQKIIIRVIYREQYKQAMQVFGEKIFLMISGSIKFYSNFFDINYPFEKYDTIFIPDSKYGAMEFPAAVTCRESIIPQRDECNNDFSDVARIIFHETAHMWFGNMVTMKWWNDLWLNESFAEYIAFVCYENLKEDDIYKSFLHCDAWVKFVQQKDWGYKCDALHTSHPIMNKIENTEVAEMSFDGITYSKGASVMKQIVSLIGFNTFRNAMRNYVKIYKWKNADINELFECLQNAINVDQIRSSYQNKHVCPKELSENSDMEDNEEEEINENYSYECIADAFNQMKWKEDWINSAGTNRIRCNYDVDNELLKITQTPVSMQFPYLRFHKIKIAFYNVSGKVLDILDVIVQNQKETIIRYSHPLVNDCTAILPNYDDLDFVKFELDPSSEMIFCNILDKIQSPVSKSLLFKYFEDLVVENKLPPATFIDQVLAAITNETENVVDFCLSMVSRITYSYSPLTFQQDFGEKAFMKVVMMYIQREEEKEFKNMCKGWMIHFANSESTLKTLVDGWRNENELFSDCTQDFAGDDQWILIQKMVGSPFFSKEVKLETFHKYKEIDHSDIATSYIRKIHSMLICSKEERIEKVKEQMDPNNQMGQTELIDEMDGFMHYTHGTDVLNYHTQYFFENILDTMRNTSHERGDTIFNKLIPKTLNYTLMKCKKQKDIMEQLNPNESYIKTLITNTLEAAMTRIGAIGIEALSNQIFEFENDTEIPNENSMELEKIVYECGIEKSDTSDDMLTEESNTQQE